ncbi:MAG: hypothetical protein L0226_03500 [Acidobacteria bacterium]|nr:hypothetical protein [Acidobacteriota bacterium]
MIIDRSLAWLKRTNLGRQIAKAKIIARNQNDLGAPGKLPGWLEAYDSKRIDPDGVIRNDYEDYVTSISEADKVISLELAYLLWFILNNIRPRSVVDLGSGFSSYLFRSYQKRCAETGEDCRVLSCDDDEYWLKCTARFLQRKGLSFSGLLLWNEFLARHGHEKPDLILHDLGCMPVRLKTLADVLALGSARTITIVDDIHKEPMRQAVLKQIRDCGLRGYDLTGFTYDRFGRYAWMLTA